MAEAFKIGGTRRPFARHESPMYGVMELVRGTRPTRISHHFSAAGAIAHALTLRAKARAAGERKILWVEGLERSTRMRPSRHPGHRESAANDRRARVR